jgi:hypothetical protein
MPDHDQPPSLPRSYQDGTGSFAMYTIYHSSDRPLRWELVRHIVNRSEDATSRSAMAIFVGRSLAECRAVVPKRCNLMLSRSADDHPSVVESWF